MRVGKRMVGSIAITITELPEGKPPTLLVGFPKGIPEGLREHPLSPVTLF